MGWIEGSGICIATSSSGVSSSGPRPAPPRRDGMPSRARASRMESADCAAARVEVARAGTEHGNRRARSCSTDYITPIRLRMVANCNGDTVPNARVVLNGPDANDPRTIVTSENGFFEFHDLRPGMTYQISISAKDSETWTSPAITIGSGQRCGNCFVVTAGLAAEVCSQSSWVYWRGI